mmetsp:Transcript_14022/g.41669  ORF Transcript_14022/g.41669 Transcript_14022/m.41669 type:complete len:218 (+) Transcript_14022:405-1058(+)
MDFRASVRTAAGPKGLLIGGTQPSMASWPLSCSRSYLGIQMPNVLRQRMLRPLALAGLGTFESSPQVQQTTLLTGAILTAMRMTSSSTTSSISRCFPQLMLPPQGSTRMSHDHCSESHHRASQACAPFHSWRTRQPAGRATWLNCRCRLVFDSPTLVGTVPPRLQFFGRDGTTVTLPFSRSRAATQWRITTMTTRAILCWTGAPLAGPLTLGQTRTA